MCAVLLATKGVRAAVATKDMDLKRALVCGFAGTLCLMLGFYSSTFAAYDGEEQLSHSRHLLCAFMSAPRLVCNILHSIVPHAGHLLLVIIRALQLCVLAALNAPFTSLVATGCFGGAVYFGLVKNLRKDIIKQLRQNFSALLPHKD